MKLCRLEDLKGNETIARTVFTSSFTVLLPEGTKLKPEYIEKLQNLEIREVYIEEENNYDTEEILILTDDIEKKFKRKIKSILEKHTYNKNSGLIEISDTAEHIIDNILEEKEVVEKIYDIKERSADVYEHSLSVCALATIVALKLNLDQEKIHDIGVGSLLHDIGLRYLTISFENRSLEDFDAVELAEYKKHPIYGYTALKNENWLTEIGKNVILYHHERMDGSGYPLRAKDIPMEAKIVGCCDAFDEMICGIGCKQSKVYEAVEYLKSFRGVYFDEKILDILLESTAVYPVGSIVVTSEGEEAVVKRQNAHFPDRPILQILKDKDGNELHQEVIKDMLKENSLFIEKVRE